VGKQDPFASAPQPGALYPQKVPSAHLWAFASFPVVTAPVVVAGRGSGDGPACAFVVVAMGRASGDGPACGVAGGDEQWTRQTRRPSGSSRFTPGDYRLGRVGQEHDQADASAGSKGTVRFTRSYAESFIR
jgi:hypothetical protein